jgi:starvation-inducible DNA-binding protein
LQEINIGGVKQMKLDRRIVERKLNEKRLINEDAVPATLESQLRKILADNFTLYFKTATFHWNVEGSDFAQYHEFLGDFYGQVYDTIDKLAEELRALKVYAPFSLTDMLSHKSLSDSTAVVTSGAQMFPILLADLEANIESLKVGVHLAEAAGELGLSNYFQDQIDAGRKTAWMLRSFSK